LGSIEINQAPIAQQVEAPAIPNKNPVKSLKNLLLPFLHEKNTKIAENKRKGLLN